MSNKLWMFTLVIGALLPPEIQAQDAAPPAETEAAAATAEESTAAPTEAAPAEASATDAAAPDAAASAEAEAAPATTEEPAAASAESEAPAAEASSADSAASAEPAAEETAAEESSEPAGEREPFEFYVGADRSRMTFSISDEAMKQRFDPAAAEGARRSDYSSYFYTLRAGIRLFHAVGFEGQYGIKEDNGEDAGQVEVKDFFAFYLVPTATVLNLFELSARIGYASFETANSSASNSSDGVTFGVGAEFPIKQFIEFFPDIRITSGVTVWHVGEEARSYGFHYGLRYDFKI